MVVCKRRGIYGAMHEKKYLWWCAFEEVFIVVYIIVMLYCYFSNPVRLLRVLSVSFQ